MVWLTTLLAGVISPGLPIMALPTDGATNVAADIGILYLQLLDSYPSSGISISTSAGERKRILRSRRDTDTGSIDDLQRVTAGNRNFILHAETFALGSFTTQ